MLKLISIWIDSFSAKSFVLSRITYHSFQIGSKIENLCVEHPKHKKNELPKKLVKNLNYEFACG